MTTGKNDTAKWLYGCRIWVTWHLTGPAPRYQLWEFIGMNGDRYLFREYKGTATYFITQVGLMNHAIRPFLINSHLHLEGDTLEERPCR
jgi:hypothetical protein